MSFPIPVCQRIGQNFCKINEMCRKFALPYTFPICMKSIKYYYHLVLHTRNTFTHELPQIFLNEKLHYSSGYSVSLTPSDAGVEWSSPATNYVTVSHDLSLPERTVITVKITRDN